jgi:endo-1,3-1,4-beta-glycanase ExoK
MSGNIGKNLIVLFSAVLIVALHAGSAHAQSVFFDDFNYTSSSDPTLLNFGWAPRSGGGGPGIGTWDPNHITFIPDPADSTNELMQMAASTSGTASTTVQTEILTPFQFLHGTFAARVKFADAPQTGPDGDQLYQTFFTISPYKSRPYSEIDFEYLPNGYGSVATPHFFFTLWQTTHKNVSTNIVASYAGWHTLLVDDAEGVHTHFYVDGVLVYTASVY